MTKTVVVTGAGSGIGRAIAMTLAGRDWRVVVTDINGDAAREVKAALTNPDAGHESAVLNVSVPDDAAAVAFSVADRLGLDAWVSNAGISFMHRFLDAPIERYDQTLDVNLKGVFVCGQAAARADGARRYQRRDREHRIDGRQAGPGAVPLRLCGVEVRCRRTHPGDGVRTRRARHHRQLRLPRFRRNPMQSRELEWEAQLRGTTTDGVRTMMIDDTPLGRLEQPEDVARAVAFLLSDDARFITGEALAVNGGAYMD